MSTASPVSIAFAPAVSVDFDLTLIVPAYNEMTRLPRTLDGLAAWTERLPFSVEILVVDDGSRDETAAVAAAHACGCGVIRLLDNSGKGAAVRTGMLLARGGVIGFTDADLPYRLDALERAYGMISAGIADAVYGSRDLESSTTEVRRSATRALASRCFRAIAGWLAASEYTDTQCGLKLFSREAAREVFSRVSTTGFAFDAEAILVTQRLGLRATRVPVALVSEAGSTVSLRRHAIPMLRDVVKARMRHGHGPAAPSSSLPAYGILRAASRTVRRAA